MLKCKNKFMPEGREFDNNELLTADLHFHYYAMNKNDDLIQGYYLQIYTNDVICDSL